MKLTRIEAKDFLQHEKLDITITGALIGILGPNGVGKSNFLNAARYAFGGEVPGKNKDELLRWGASTPGFVKAYFMHNGIQGSILRGVPTGRVEFIYGEHIRATGATAVAEAMLANLGIDKSIVAMMFIPQGELDAVLFDQASKRELAFQNMCGIGDAAKIHKRLGEVIVDKFPPLPDYDGQIAIGIQQQEQYRREEQGFQREIAGLETQLAGCSNEEALQTQRAQLQRVKLALDRVVELNASVSRVKQVIDGDRPLAAELQKATEGIDLQAIDKSLADANTQWRAATAYRSARANYEQAVKAAQAVGACPVDANTVAALKTATDELQAAVGNDAGTIKMYDDLHKVLNANKMQGTECPLCGSQISDVQALRGRIATQLTALRTAYQAKQAQFTAASGSLNKAQRDIAMHAGASQSAQQRVQQATQAFQATPATELDPAALESEIRMIEGVRKDMTAMFQRKSVIEARLESNLRHMQELEAAAAAALVTVQELPDLAQLPSTEGASTAASMLLQLDTQLRGIQATRVQLAGYQGRLGQMQQAMANIKTTLEDLERRRGQQDTYKSVVMTLTHVRDSMHYSALPHTLAVHVMQDLSDTVCAFLERLNATFRVQTSTTDLSFKCMFVDGRPEPEGGADEATLSGGQKVLLAVAFRFASYSMFASRVGLLSLDEPTCFLDDANIGNFCNLLERIKEVAKNLDLQILMSTHERSVIPHLDTVIDLTPA